MPPNVHEPDFDEERDEPPFGWRRARLGHQAGARKLGASLYEVPPGASTFPFHFHHANEELIVVLEGRPTLRTPDGERELERGEVVACLPGAEGAHRIDNRSSEAARVLIVSTMIGPDVNEFPDSGKVWARTWPPGGERGPGDAELLARPEDNLDYMDGER